MTCQHCETRSGIFDMTKRCCAVRFLLSWPGSPEKTAAEICVKYGHDIDELRAEARRVKHAARAAMADGVAPR